MVEFFDKMIETKEEWLQLMADHLSGSCMNSVDGTMEDEYYLPGIKFWNITEEEFARYLDDNCIFECDTCGWWTYSGEGDGVTCDDCLEDRKDEEDY